MTKPTRLPSLEYYCFFSFVINKASSYYFAS